MDRNRMQLILAFLLGAMIPSLFLQWAPARMDGGAQDNIPTHTTGPAAERPQEGQAAMIPVLLEDGTIEEMKLDAYLLCVVLAEMPASFEPEALKAQAVVARTYALKRLEEGVRHPSGAVCTESSCCQAYISEADYLVDRGYEADVEKIRQAVDATTGLVLTYQGELAEATYFSCSGGRTEDAAAVWGADIPYLQAVDSPGEEDAASYTDTVYFTREEFAEKLGRTLTGTPDDWLGIVTYTEGGGVAAMVVAGKSYTGVSLRKLLGLNSTAFTMTADADGIWVSTLGHGHRVGMSQYGADAMAVQGSTFEEILSHYYPGTKIDKIPALR